LPQVFSNSTRLLSYVGRQIFFFGQIKRHRQDGTTIRYHIFRLFRKVLPGSIDFTHHKQHNALQPLNNDQLMEIERIW